MTEEEVQKLQEATEAAEKRAAEAEQAAEAAKAEADKVLEGVVNELKEERAKKNEALEALEKFNNPKPEGEEQTPDVNKAVEEALAKRESERIKNDVERAIEEFKASKTEFQEDTAGIKFEKFKKELSRFSFADVDSKEKAKERLEEAYRFVKGTTSNDEEPAYDGAPRTPSTPGGEDPNAVTPDIKKTLEANGVTEEKFNKLASKSTYADALASLGLGR